MHTGRMSARLVLAGSLAAIALTQQAKAQYSLASLETAVVEQFTSYNGQSGGLANWTVTSPRFNGQGTGSSTTGGVWSFGTAGSDERSLGYLPSSTAASFTATTTYINNTGSAITGLDISYDAEQWKFQASRTNGFAVSYSINGALFVDLPALAFTGSTSGTPPTSVALATSIGDLMNPGDTLTLKFFGDRGPGSGSSQAIAIDNLSLTPHGTVTGNNSAITADAGSVSFGRVIIGASASQNVNLSKTGNDATDYTIAASGAASVTPTGTQSFAAGSQTQLLQIGVDASTIGTQNGAVVVDNLATTTGGSGQGSDDTDDSIAVSADVVGHAKPSFTVDSVTTSTSIDLGIRAQGSAASQSFVVANAADLAATAGLDIDSIDSSGDIAKASSNASTLSNLANATSQGFLASLDTTSIGSFSSQYTLHVSDENLPGATDLGTLSLSITGRVALGGDADLDNKVNTLDFNLLAGNFGSGTIWQEGDFNRDGTIDSTDFGMLVDNFGKSAVLAPSLGSAVPEPASIVSLALAAGLLSRRRN